MDQVALHRLAALARQQHGVVGYRQLANVGVSAEVVREFVERGVLVRVDRQAYEFVGVPDTWHNRLHTALVSLGPEAVVSHQAAARLHRLDRFTRDALEFTVRRRRRGAATHGAVVHTSLVMPAIDIIRIDGMPCTTAARTIIDLAALRIKDVRLEAAIDSAMRLGLTDLDHLLDRLRALRGKGRRGVRRIDRLLITSGGHSVLERAFLQIVHRYGFPQPELQARHERQGAFIARVDFLFREWGVVVEVSGGRGHSTAADRAKDARRRNELQDMGRLVLEFTYEDVMERVPYVVATLKQAFMSRSAGD